MATAPQRGFVQNFEIYCNDNGSERWLGIGSVDLPEFNAKTVDISGTGILGEISLPVPAMIESMELTIHGRTINLDLSSLSNQYTAHALTLRAAQINYDSANGTMLTEPIKIYVQGTTKNYKPGKFEPASESDTEVTLEITHYKETINGQDSIEYDKFNQVYKVDGVDLLIDTRSALGL